MDRPNMSVWLGIILVRMRWAYRPRAKELVLTSVPVLTRDQFAHDGEAACCAL